MRESGMINTVITWVVDRSHRLHYWSRVIKPCRFPLVLVIVGGGVLLLVPQAQDMLRAFAVRIEGERTDNWLRFFFVLSALLWVLSSWYWSRVMLLLEFPDVPGNEPGLHPFRTIAPRCIGFAAAASIAAALFKASFGYDDTDPERLLLREYALGSIVGGFVFLYLAWKRRDWTRAAHKKLQSVGLLRQLAPRIVRLFDVQSAGELKYGTKKRLADLPSGVKATAASTLALAAALFLLFVFALQRTAPLLGTAAILLFAAAGWTAVGSLLDFIGMRLRFPIIISLVALAAVFSLWNDNHAVRTLDDAPVPLDRRMTLVAELEKWYQHQRERPSPDGTYPFFVVSAEGGGVRAAYWTANVLAQIQDANPCFADQVFALSGVSGGSLGSAVFMAQLADERAGVDGFRCDQTGKPAAGVKLLKPVAQNVLGGNFLAPVMAAMLYPDLVQRFLPFKVERFDRARALERAWERAWRKQGGSNRFAEPFDNLWRDHTETWMPVLFLNSTWVETGKRLIVSNMRLTPDDFVDAEDLNAFYTDRSLALSTAVHLSARFTYISPAGTIEKDRKTYARAVDGGYFENSGTTAVLEVLKTLDQLAASDAGWQKVRPVVIHISNEPIKDGYAGVHVSTDKKDTAAKPGKCLNEILSPPMTLLNARGARGEYARETLKWHVGEENFLHFGLCRKEVSIPLGWALSRLAQEEMEKQLTRMSCAAFDNPKNLETIDKIVKARYVKTKRLTKQL
jgi:hypothetical protein